MDADTITTIILAVGSAFAGGGGIWAKGRFQKRLSEGELRDKWTKEKDAEVEAARRAEEQQRMIIRDEIADAMEPNTAAVNRLADALEDLNETREQTGSGLAQK